MLALGWLWFVGLSLVTAACWRRFRTCADEAAQIGWGAVAMASASAAWRLSWPQLGEPVLWLLHQLIGDAGTAAHDATVALILSLLVAVWLWVVSALSRLALCVHHGA